MLAGVTRVGLQLLAPRFGRLVRKRIEELHRKPLSLPILCVLEGQIKEGAFEGRELPVVALLDAFPAGGEGLVILLKRRGRASVNIARELVEQNN